MSLWRQVPTLAGRHVTLRPLVREDEGALVAAACEGGLWDLFYANVSMMKTPDRWFFAALSEQDYGRALVFAVEDAGGTVVGSTRLMRLAARMDRVLRLHEGRLA